MPAEAKNSCSCCVFSVLTFGIVRYDQSGGTGSVVLRYGHENVRPGCNQPGPLHLAFSDTAKDFGTASLSDKNPRLTLTQRDSLCSSQQQRSDKDILDSPGFDLVSALQAHRQALQVKIERMQTLINTLDNTVLHLVGDIKMSKKKKIFEGFSEEKQAQYQEEAMRRYGAETVAQSVKLWNSYSEQQKQQIRDEGGTIYLDLVDTMPSGSRSEQTQAIIVRWHEHLRHFYEPSIEVLGGLGQTYRDDPDFRAFFTAIHADLPDFLAEAITLYVARLETEWLRQELGILEE
jgi:MerR family transcriptional regulator, thiopeptide resistance regulator